MEKNKRLFGPQTPIPAHSQYYSARGPRSHSLSRARMLNLWPLTCRTRSTEDHSAARTVFTSLADRWGHAVSRNLPPSTARTGLARVGRIHRAKSCRVARRSSTECMAELRGLLALTLGIRSCPAALFSRTVQSDCVEPPLTLGGRDPVRHHPHPRLAI
jgi:hypothetical protein